MRLLFFLLRNPSLLLFSVFFVAVLTVLLKSLFIFGSLVFDGWASMAATGHPSYITYSTVTGYFLQDDPATDSSTFDYVCCPLTD